MESSADRLLSNWARRLDQGFFTPDEIARATLGVFAEAADLAAAWASAPEPVQGAVMAYLTRVGPAGVPPPYKVGAAPDPELLAAEHARLQAVAAEVLARFTNRGD